MDLAVGGSSSQQPAVAGAVHETWAPPPSQPPPQQPQQLLDADSTPGSEYGGHGSEDDYAWLPGLAELVALLAGDGAAGLEELLVGMWGPGELGGMQQEHPAAGAAQQLAAGAAGQLATGTGERPQQQQQLLPSTQTQTQQPAGPSARGSAVAQERHYLLAVQMLPPGAAAAHEGPGAAGAAVQPAPPAAGPHAAPSYHQPCAPPFAPPYAPHCPMMQLCDGGPMMPPPPPATATAATVAAAATAAAPLGSAHHQGGGFAGDGGGGGGRSGLPDVASLPLHHQQQYQHHQQHHQHSQLPQHCDLPHTQPLQQLSPGMVAAASAAAVEALQQRALGRAPSLVELQQAVGEGIQQLLCNAAAAAGPCISGGGGGAGGSGTAAGHAMAGGLQATLLLAQNAGSSWRCGSNAAPMSPLGATGGGARALNVLAPPHQPPMGPFQPPPTQRQQPPAAMEAAAVNPALHPRAHEHQLQRRPPQPQPLQQATGMAAAVTAAARRPTYPTALDMQPVLARMLSADIAHKDFWSAYSDKAVSKTLADVAGLLPPAPAASAASAAPAEGSGGGDEGGGIRSLAIYDTLPIELFRTRFLRTHRGQPYACVWPLDPTEPDFAGGTGGLGKSKFYPLPPRQQPANPNLVQRLRSLLPSSSSGGSGGGGDGGGGGGGGAAVAPAATAGTGWPLVPGQWYFVHPAYLVHCLKHHNVRNNGCTRTPGHVTHTMHRSCLVFCTSVRYVEKLGSTPTMPKPVAGKLGDGFDGFLMEKVGRELPPEVAAQQVEWFGAAVCTIVYGTSWPAYYMAKPPKAAAVQCAAEAAAAVAQCAVATATATATAAAAAAAAAASEPEAAAAAEAAEGGSLAERRAAAAAAGEATRGAVAAGRPNNTLGAAGPPSGAGGGAAAGADAAAAKPEAAGAADGAVQHRTAAGPGVAPMEMEARMDPQPRLRRPALMGADGDDGTGGPPAALKMVAAPVGGARGSGGRQQHDDARLVSECIGPFLSMKNATPSLFRVLLKEEFLSDDGQPDLARLVNMRNGHPDGQGIMNAIIHAALALEGLLIPKDQSAAPAQQHPAAPAVQAAAAPPPPPPPPPPGRLLRVMSDGMQGKVVSLFKVLLEICGAGSGGTTGGGQSSDGGGSGGSALRRASRLLLLTQQEYEWHDTVLHTCCKYGLVHVLEWLLPQVNAAALTVPTKSGWCVLHTAARAEHGRAVEVTAMMLRRCRDLGLFTPERLAIPGDGEQDGVTTSVLLCDLTPFNKHYRRVGARRVLDAAMERVWDDPASRPHVRTDVQGPEELRTEMQRLNLRCGVAERDRAAGEGGART